MKFEWVARKAEANLRKHRVSFADAITVFADPLARIHDDPEHSVGVRREFIIGRSAAGLLVLVSFSEPGDSVRINQRTARYTARTK